MPIRLEAESLSSYGSLEGAEQDRRDRQEGSVHREEEILPVLRQAESGDTVMEFRRKRGVGHTRFPLEEEERGSGSE
jgi:hypothetical protein